MQLHCLFYLGTFVSKNANKFGDKVAIALVKFYWDRLQVSFPIGENSTLEIFQSVNSRTVILAQFDHVFTLLRKYGISEKANTQFHQWEFNIIFTLFLWKKINVSLWHKKVFFSRNALAIRQPLWDFNCSSQFNILDFNRPFLILNV